MPGAAVHEYRGSILRCVAVRSPISRDSPRETLPAEQCRSARSRSGSPRSNFLYRTHGSDQLLVFKAVTAAVYHHTPDFSMRRQLAFARYGVLALLVRLASRPSLAKPMDELPTPSLVARSRGVNTRPRQRSCRRFRSGGQAQYQYRKSLADAEPSDRLCACAAAGRSMPRRAHAVAKPASKATGFIAARHAQDLLQLASPVSPRRAGGCPRRSLPRHAADMPGNGLPPLQISATGCSAAGGWHTGGRGAIIGGASTTGPQWGNATAKKPPASKSSAAADRATGSPRRQ